MGRSEFGGTHVIEYRGEVFTRMSVEERLTVCNMSIEAGARAGLTAPDKTVFRYLKGRALSPKGQEWEDSELVEDTIPMKMPVSTSVTISTDNVGPTVTWGTSPEDTVEIDGFVPDPNSFSDPSKKKAAIKSLDYMGLEPGQR